MIRIREYATICFAVLLGCQPVYSAKSDMSQLQQAKQLMEAGKPVSAKAILRKVVLNEPNNVDAHVQLGAVLAALAEKDNYGEAIAEEKKAIALDAKSSNAHRVLGMIYANLHKNDESISMLQEACKLDPSSVAAYRDLGNTYLAAERPDDAVVALKKAKELNPKNTVVRSKLALVFTLQKKYPAAIQEAEDLLKLDESRPETRLLLANIKMRSGDTTGAIEAYKSTIECPGFDSSGKKNSLTAASAYSGLGQAILESKSDGATLEEAVAYQRKAIKAAPLFMPAYIRLAELLDKQNKPKDSEKLYKQILSSSDFNGVAALSYARFLSHAKREEEARQVLKQVLAKSPGDKQATEALAALTKLVTP